MSDTARELREMANWLAAEYGGAAEERVEWRAADEIERLREQADRLLDIGEEETARADRAEARLRAVVRLLADLTPIGDRQRSRLVMYMDAAGYEWCGWCNGEGLIRDNERNEERPCDCIHGWRPKGDDDD